MVVSHHQCVGDSIPQVMSREETEEDRCQPDHQPHIPLSFLFLFSQFIRLYFQSEKRMDSELVRERKILRCTSPVRYLEPGKNHSSVEKNSAHNSSSGLGHTYIISLLLQKSTQFSHHQSSSCRFYFKSVCYIYMRS